MENSTLPTRSQRHPGTAETSESGLSIGSTESLEDYKYSPLVGQDIRVLELLPGDDDEDVRIRILHCPLRERPSKSDPRMSLQALQETPPQGWHVCETSEGRYLFFQYDWETRKYTDSAWRHPDPTFDASQCERAPDAGECEEEEGQRTQFEALSYAWDQPQKEPLYIRVENGIQHFKLNVRPNLMSALQHLRPQGTGASRAMWIDAICLDQENHKEKSLHIPRMRDIYRLARRTVTWLGPQSDTTDLAFETVKHIASNVELSHGPSLMLLPSPSSVEDWYGIETGLTSLNLSAEAIDALSSLLSLSWFQRLWVLQEVQLSNHTGPRGSAMYWGSRTIARSELSKAVTSIYMKFLHGWSFTGVKLESSIILAQELLQPTTGGLVPNLQALFRYNTARGCCDDRDRVYGLLGLAGPRFSKELKISYDDTYRVADVNRDAFLTHTSLTGRLELLDPQEPSHRQVLVDAPSWVPEWSGDSAGVSYLFRSTFSANNTRAHIKHDKENPDVLHLLGVQCAVIDEVTESLEWHVAEHPWEALNHVRSWQPHNLDTAISQPTGETLREAYAVTLRQAELDERWPYKKFPPIQQWVEQDYPDALFGLGSVAQNSDQGFLSTAQTLHRHVVEALRYCSGRRFFRTKEGYMGIANRDTQKDDMVAILLGCVTPVILRPVHGTDSHSEFSWIGDCFVHGLHDSIKLLGPMPPLWKGVIDFYGHSRIRLLFQNQESGQMTWKDPRLPPLEEWEDFWPEIVEQHHPMDPIFLRHRSTGEEITYDPRLEPEHLEARGVDLTWFTLV